MSSSIWAPVWVPSALFPIQLPANTQENSERQPESFSPCIPLGDLEETPSSWLQTNNSSCSNIHGVNQQSEDPLSLSVSFPPTQLNIFLWMAVNILHMWTTNKFNWKDLKPTLMLQIRGKSKERSWQSVSNRVLSHPFTADSNRQSWYCHFGWTDSNASYFSSSLSRI